MASFMAKQKTLLTDLIEQKMLCYEASGKGKLGARESHNMTLKVLQARIAIVIKKLIASIEI